MQLEEVQTDFVARGVIDFYTISYMVFATASGNCLT